jgi:hypothetical protein
MISATCHCGAVRIEIPAAPERLTECNCSLCRRLGTLCAYYPLDAVRVTGHPEHTAEYIWGDRTMRTVRCAHCGCTTHWEPLGPDAENRCGVNMRMFDPAVFADAQVRHFDGAESWTFLD